MNKYNTIEIKLFSGFIHFVCTYFIAVKSELIIFVDHTFIYFDMSKDPFRAVSLYEEKRKYLGFHLRFMYSPNSPDRFLERLRKYIPDVEGYYTTLLETGAYELTIVSIRGLETAIGVMPCAAKYPTESCTDMRITLSDFAAPYQMLNRYSFEQFLNTKKLRCCFRHNEKLKLPYRSYFVIEDTRKWERIKNNIKYGFIRLFVCGRDRRGAYHKVRIKSVTISRLKYINNVWSVNGETITPPQLSWRLGTNHTSFRSFLKKLDTDTEYGLLRLIPA